MNVDSAMRLHSCCADDGRILGIAMAKSRVLSEVRADLTLGSGRRSLHLRMMSVWLSLSGQ